MIKRTFLIVTLLGGTGSYAEAGQPGADWIPMDQVVRKLSEAGYGEIRSLKADDGLWEAKAVKDGKPVAIAIDPRSGGISTLPETKKSIRTEDQDRDDD